MKGGSGVLPQKIFAKISTKSGNSGHFLCVNIQRSTVMAQEEGYHNALKHA